MKRIGINDIQNRALRRLVIVLTFVPLWVAGMLVGYLGIAAELLAQAILAVANPYLALRALLKLAVSSWRAP